MDEWAASGKHPIHAKTKASVIVQCGATLSHAFRWTVNNYIRLTQILCENQVTSVPFFVVVYSQ